LYLVFILVFGFFFYLPLPTPFFLLSNSLSLSLFGLIMATYLFTDAQSIATRQTVVQWANDIARVTALSLFVSAPFLCLLDTVFIYKQCYHLEPVVGRAKK